LRQPNLKTSSFNRSSKHLRVAILAGAVLILAQLVCASHFHNPVGARETLQGAVTSNFEFCPICLVAFHAPATPAKPGPPLSVLLESKFVPPDVRACFAEVALADHFGRAPPASF
jgi:hypothetical protein